MKRTILLSLAIVAIAPAAAAQDLSPAPRDTRVRFLAVDLATRTTFVEDAGYDPYSTDNRLTQGSLGVTATAIVRGAWSFAPGLRWDFGGASAKARGADASLSAHRLTVPLELRNHLGSWMYAFLRLAPGAMHEGQTIRDASLTEPLVASSWVLAADASLGASFLVASFSRDPASHAPRLWLTPEVGYAWSSAGRSSLSPDADPDDPRPFGSLTFPRLAVRGPFFRIGAAMSF